MDPRIVSSSSHQQPSVKFVASTQSSSAATPINPSYFLSPEKDLSRKAGAVTERRILEGQAEYQSCIGLGATNDSTSLSETKLTELLKHLIMLSKKVTLPVGCSTILDLFEDKLYSSYRECLIELHSQLSGIVFEAAPQSTAIHPSLLRRNDKPVQLSKREAFNVLMSKLQIGLGELQGHLQNQGNAWSCPIVLRSHGSASSARSSFLMIATDVETRLNSLNLRGATFQQLMKTIAMLKEIVAQGVHLGTLLEQKPILNNYFKRLLWRLKRLKQGFSSYGEISFLKAANKSEYVEMYKKEVAILLPICDRIEVDLSILLQNPTPKPEILRRLYHDFREALRLKSNFIHFLKVDRDQKEGSSATENVVESSNASFCEHVWFSYREPFNNLCRDGLLVITYHFIEVSKVSREEITSCLNRVIEVLEFLQTASSQKQSIEQLFNEFEKSNDADQEVIEGLQILWGAIKMPISFLPAYLQAFKTRKDVCEQSNSSTTDWALALRDVIELFNHKLHNIFTESCEWLTHLWKNEQILFPQQAENLSHLYHALEGLANLESQMIATVVYSVESLIGKCFEQFAQNSAEKSHAAEQSAAALTKLGQNRKKKNKKAHKQKATHLTVKATTTEPTVKTDHPTKPSDVALSLPRIAREINPLEMVENIFKSASEIKQLSLEGPDEMFRRHWRNACLGNIKHVLYQLKETIPDQTFTYNTIFGELDAIRRLIEHALGIALTHFPLVDQGKSFFQEHFNRTHLLHLYVQQILFCVQANQVIPANVRCVVYALRQTPDLLSDANACVHYLYSTALKTNLSDKSEALINYLRSVDIRVAAREAHPDNELLSQHRHLIHDALFFVQELLMAILNPSYGLDRYSLPTADIVVPNPIMPIAPNEETIVQNLTETFKQAAEAESKKIRIYDRKSAVKAIEEALIWITLCMMNPLEGHLETHRRRACRDSALQNVRLYLSWLKDKLETPELSRPYDSCLETIRLLRRAHKELALSLLYHGHYYSNSQHIVFQQDLSHVNNPCLLNRILRKYSSCADKLPNLDETLGWMKRVHQIFSYPKPLVAEAKDSVVDQALRTLARKAKKLAKTACSEGFTMVLGQGTTIEYAKHKELTRSFIDEQDRQKIFPALVALLQTLRHGIKLPKSFLAME